MNINLKNIIVLALLLIGNGLLGQKKEWLRFGNEALVEKDYYGASKYLEKVYELDTTDFVLIYKLGQAYKGYNNFKKSEKYFKKIFNSDSLVAYPEVAYWLGILSKNQTKYIEADNFFKMYLRLESDKRKLLYLRAKNEVKNYSRVIRLLKDTLDFNIVNLGPKLNTGVAEFGSVPINDSLMIFTSLRAEKINEEGAVEDEFYVAKLFYGEKQDSLWATKKSIDKLGSLGFSIANGCFNSDYSVFYYSVCSEQGDCNVYQADFNLQTKIFSNPSILPSSINMVGASTTQPFVFKEAGKTYLLFVSNRVRGKGGMDIWISEKKKGKWSRARNLGNKINTKGNELSPHYDEAKQVLYFSSDWHYNLGGYDVFQSNGGIKNLQFVKNIGLPLNSSVNDLYFSPVDSSKGFVTSTRKGSVSNKDAVCCNDIFKYEIPKKEKKKDSVVSSPEVLTRLQKLVEDYHVTLYFHNDEPDARSWDTITKFNYLTKYEEYKSLIPKYQKEFSKNLEGKDSISAIEEIDDFFLNYVDRGVEDLTIFSKELLKELDAGYKIELTVKGYASPLAKSNYNVNLTLRRVSSMQNFLREYEGGVYNKYLDGTANNGAFLKIKKVPFGEYKSKSGVSDNYYDTRNSVYNRRAALERKIEIINLNLLVDSSQFEFPVAADTIKYNVGKQDSSVFVVPIIFTNHNKDSVNIDSVYSNCPCSRFNFVSHKLKKGDKKTLKITFDMQDEKGLLGRRILYRTSDGKEHVIEVSFEL